MTTNSSDELQAATDIELQIVDGGANPLEGIACDTARAAVSAFSFGGLSRFPGGTSDGAVEGLIHEPTHQ